MKCIQHIIKENIMEKKYIFANWKMNYGGKDALSFLQTLLEKIPTTSQRNLIFCPPHTALWMLTSYFGRALTLAGQNCFHEEKGAFTGEVSPSMLKDIGCAYVLIGHSERRNYFGETDDMAAKKVDAAAKAGLVPVLCVGEPLEARERNAHFAFVEKQLESCATHPRER
jgi:triosephosphate isomerase